MEPRIRELLAHGQASQPRDRGADRLARSVRVLRSRVAELRPVDLPSDPSSRPYEPGEDMYPSGSPV